MLSILQKVIKPDSASGSVTAAEEIIRHLEEENTMLRLKLHLMQMEKMITSRHHRRHHQSNGVVSRMEEKIETAGKRWGNNKFNLCRD